MARFYGNQSALSVLHSLQGSGRVTHALLITGDEGLGKKTFARLCAAAFLKADDAACGKIEAGIHPDCVTISPEKGKKSTSVAQIRALIADAAVLPNESACKVYILIGCEEMDPRTQNTLLKILEEPPAHVRLILLATHTAQLLPTILSRVVQIPLQPVEKDDCLCAVQDACGVTFEEATDAFRMFGGNIGKCLQALADPEKMRPFSIAADAARALAQGSEYGVYAALHKAESSRELFSDVLRALGGLLRDSMLLKSGRTVPSGLDLALSQKLCAQLPLARLCGAFSAAQEGITLMEKNANISLSIALVSARLYTDQGFGAGQGIS